MSIKDNNKKKPQHKRWVHHDGDYSNVKNIEYNLRETQKFIQNARYTIVKMIINMQLITSLKRKGRIRSSKKTKYS